MNSYDKYLELKEEGRIKDNPRKEYPVYSGWRIIPNYNGRYLISEFGDIISTKRNKILRPHKSKSSGYVMCTLINNEGGKDVCYLHQLMAITFIDSEYKSKKLVVDHIDRDRANNDLSNLRVVTQSKNLENRDCKNYYYCRKRNKFVAQIKRNGRVYKKRFKTEKEAINFIKKIKNNEL